MDPGQLIKPLPMTTDFAFFTTEPRQNRVSPLGSTLSAIHLNQIESFTSKVEYLPIEERETAFALVRRLHQLA